MIDLRLRYKKKMKRDYENISNIREKAFSLGKIGGYYDLEER